MKKLIMTLAGILTASAGWALDWNVVENFALNAPVTVSTNVGAAGTITDGNDGSSWQASPRTPHPDMFIVDLGQSRTINQMQFMWEASHPNNYDIYVSETAIPSESRDGCNVVPDSWLDANTPVISREVPGNAGATDEFELSTPVTGQYILVMGTALNPNATSYGSRCFEFRCGYLVREASKASAVKLTVTNPDAITAVGMEYNISAEVVDQYGDKMDFQPTFQTEGATVADGKLKVTAKGQVSVKAVYGELTSQEVTMNALVDLAQYVEGGTITCDTDLGTADQLFDGGATLSNNGAQFMLANGGDKDPHWLLIDKGREIDIDGIYITWEGASANKYKVEVGPTADNLTEVLAIDEPAGINARKDWVTASDKMKGARYIKISTESTGTEWGLKLFEVKVYGEAKPVDPVATQVGLTLTPSVTMAAVGQTVSASAAVYDQFGKVMDTPATITVEGPASFADGVVSFTGLGDVKIKAEGAGLSDEKDVKVVIDATHYAIDSNTTVTSDLEASDAARLFDGGADPAANGQLYEVVAQGTPEAGDRDGAHWVLVDLKRPVDVEAVVINWEGASADKYNVEMGATVETLGKVYEIDENHGVNARKDWFYGREAKGVRYIRVNTLHAASEYGTKIFDLKVYGVRGYEPAATEMKFDVKTPAPYMVGDEIRMDAGVADQYGYVMDVPVAFTSESGTITTDAETGETVFVPSAKGTVTVKGVAGELSGSVDFNVVADPVDYLDSAKFTAKGTFTNNEGEEKVDEPLPGMFDGNATENGPAEAQIGVKPAVIDIDLAGPHFIDMLTLSWEAACSGSMTVSVWGEGQTEADATEVFNIEGRKLIGGVNPVDRIAVPADKGAIRYIRLNITEPASEYGMRLFEARLYGKRDIKVVSFSAAPTVDVDGENIATDVMFLGESLSFNSKVMNNFDEEENAADYVTYTVNGVETAISDDTFAPEAEGTYELSAAVEGFEPVTATVKAVNGEQVMRYIHKGVQLSLGEGHPSSGVRDILMGGSHTGVTSIDVEGATVTVTFDTPIELSALQLRWTKGSQVSCKVNITGAAETTSRADRTETLEAADLHRLSVEGGIRQIVISDIASTFTGANLEDIAPVYADADLALENKTDEDLANEGILAGIATIDADSTDAGVRFFNLQGVEIANPAAGSIVIMRRGASAEKVLVK